MLSSTIQPLHPNNIQIILRSALAAVICLAGFIGFPFWYGLLAYLLPHPISDLLEHWLPGDVLAHNWLPISIMGGALWGWQLSHILSYPHTWRFVAACGAGVGIGQVLATGQIQRLIHPLFEGAPFHVWFAIQFLLGISAVIIMTGVALGVALRSWHIAVTLALVGSVAAVIPAFTILFILDALGVRVGVGNANMAKVIVLGFLAATLAGGAVFGWVLKSLPTHESC
jgi:hypothetical protein